VGFSIAQVWIPSLVFSRSEGTTRLPILLWNRLYSRGHTSSSNPALILPGQIVSWFASVIIHTIIYMAQAKPWLEGPGNRNVTPSRGERESEQRLFLLSVFCTSIASLTWFLWSEMLGIRPVQVRPIPNPGDAPHP
jgi:hypothetical protein